MGGKSSKSQSTVTVPQDVLARYNNVNAQAQTAASAPFQTYSGQFVAPLTDTQNAGVQNTNTSAGAAQPYYQAATGALGTGQDQSMPLYQSGIGSINQGIGVGAGLGAAALGSLQQGQGASAPLYAGAEGAISGAQGSAQPFNTQAAQGYQSALGAAQPYNSMATQLGLAGAQAVNPGQLNTQQFMSPYIQQVLQGTAGMLNQQNQQQQSGQLGTAIQSGAFGGDRAGIAAANLGQQQQLANSKIYSDILNQGYTQALGAAQQQQGVGLGAAQANRAALAGAGQQLSGIGQQVYGQGTGTAEQQAALGQQVFGQGLAGGQAQAGLAGQLFGQGQQSAQTQASLAQMLSQLGLSGGQAQIGAGQALYGQGQQTAQTLAQLGSGAQTAGLQGAQAQLAAGQVQQQTQQAQDTALYNQFLQQQSYPFQVSQFLANIAEGTGSLSGSTTTSTQPGGFFSDERLKENMHEIGKTHDGQPIYRYNYKGDGRTQIGLKAQDVEHSHPDAVGLAAGYKTVDYDKATRDSMGGSVSPSGVREGFADGGSPDFTGLASAHGQMYAPYSGGGLYGAPAGGGMYGGVQGHVPAANLPVGQLAVAKTPEKGPGVVEQMNQMAKLGENVNSGYNLGKDHGWWGKDKTGGLDPNGNDVANDEPLAVPSSAGGLRGGFADGGAPGLDIPNDAPHNTLAVAQPPQGKPRSGMDDAMDVAKIAAMVSSMRRGGRAGYAGGGMPYQTEGSGLDIPNDAPHNTLAVAQPPQGKPRSGMDDAMDVAKIAAMVSSMRRGGRAGYAGGGSPDDGLAGDDQWSPEQHQLSHSLRDLGSSAWDHVKGLFSDQSHDPEFLARRAKMDETTRGMLGGQPPMDPLGASLNRGADPVMPGLRAPAATQQPAAPAAAPVPAARRAPSPGLAPVGSPDDQLAASVAGQTQGAGDYSAPPAAAPAAPQPGLDPAQALALSQSSSGLPQPSAAGQPNSAQKPSYNVGDKLTHAGTSVLNFLKGLNLDKRENLIPLLTGVAAMGTAPTRSLGVALASGVGAGAQSYMNTAQQQARIEKTQADTANVAQGIAVNNGMVTLANGQRMLLGQYRALVAQGKAPPLAGAQQAAKLSGAPAGGGQQTADQAISGLPRSQESHNYVKDYGTSRIDQDYSRLTQLDPTQWENERAISAKTEDGIVQNAASAHTQGGTISQLSSTLMAMPDNGVLAGGAFNGIKAGLAGRANDIMRTIAGAAGVDPTPYLIADATPHDAMGLKAAADKLGAMLTFARAHGADQNSLGALEAAATAVPTTQLSKQQATSVLASLYVDKQHALDMAEYMNEYKGNAAARHPGQGDLYLAQNAQSSFRNEHSEIEYGKAKQALLDIMKRAPDIFSGKVPPAFIDRYGKENYGVENLSRFLKNQ